MSEAPATKLETPHNPLADIPAAALAAELARRQRRIQTLQRRHQRLVTEAEKLRLEIEALGGSIGAAAGALRPIAEPPRRRNPLGLIDALKAAFSGGVLSAGDAAKKVLEAGYRSNSSNFRQIVNQALAKGDHFERVERGLYRVKAG